MIRGFTADDFLDARPRFDAEMTAWIKNGQVIDRALYARYRGL